MVKLDSHSSRTDVRDPEFALGDELRGERTTKGKTLLDVQRDLRIQATYIAAIEGGTLDAFPDPSFIPGYVRSYARYLSLDSAEVYARFCAETGFTYSSGGASKKSGRSMRVSARDAARRGSSRKNENTGFQPKFPLVEPRRSLFSEIRVSALGSLLVLALLVSGLGYGGWTVLQNIQRVQFAPVEDLPIAQSDVAAIEAPEVVPEVDADLADLASPVTATTLSELYRQQEAAVPILQPRDGPIAAIDPDELGPLLIHVPGEVDPMQLATITPSDPAKAATPVVVAPLIEAIYAEARAEEAEAGAAVDADAPISIVVERAAWVRIYQENGTVLFERILERGERYMLPRGIEAPMIWAGNSGSVYVEIGGELRGPIGRKTLAVRDISLAPESLVAEFPKVDVIPEVITQRSATEGGADPAVAIQ
jgi:cytoskeleton protein RodZ